MRKIKKLSALILLGGVLLLNYQFTVAQSPGTPILDGGTVTCYSTWKSGGPWNFVKCLGCAEQSNAKNMTDSGTCN